MGPSREVLDYVSRLPIGSHAALFHENEQLAALIFNSYIRGGVERHERVFFVSTSRNDQERFLKSAQSGSGSFGARKHVTYVSLMDFAFDEGRLSRKKALAHVQKLVEDVDGSRVRGARVIVLADQYLNNASGEELARFEKQWGLSFQFPLSVVCSYDTTILAEPNWGDLILRLCRVHGHLIFRGLAAPKKESLTASHDVALAL